MGLFGSAGLKSTPRTTVADIIAALVGQDIVARSISLTQAAAAVAIQLVDGARLKLGAGTTDYMTSDGATRITAAGDFTVGGANGLNIGDATNGAVQFAGSAVLFSPATTFLRGRRSDTGGADVAVEIVNDEQLTTAGDISFRVRNGEAGVGPVLFSLGFDGSIILPSTDSSGTPGAAIINQATGRSAIAAGAASAVITNSLVTAASHVFISPRTRDATGLLPLVTTIGAGSFTVSTSANCTANLVFDWLVIS